MSSFDPENDTDKELSARLAEANETESLKTASDLGGENFNTNNDVLSAAFRSGGFGGYGNSMFSVLKGINHRGSGDVVSPNLERCFVFFTRPELNFTDDNISGVRRLRHLLNNNPYSISNYVKSTLMPHVITSTVRGLEPSLSRSPFVEERSPFIPLKTNCLKSISGWPDELMNISDMAEGMRQQVTGIVDDTPNNYSQFDLTCSFINVRSSPLFVMLSAIRQYSTTASVGGLSPFPKVKAARYLDYTQRIYVLVMDESGINIRNAACTGAAIMKGLPTGAKFNHVNDGPLNPVDDTIDVPYHCYGVRYDDPIILENFNRIVRDYNPDFFNDLVDGMRGDYKLVPHEELDVFNFEAIPYLNTDTMQLEWYCREDRYNEIMDEVSQFR